MIRIQDANGNVLDIASGNTVDIERYTNFGITVFFGDHYKDGFWQDVATSDLVARHMASGPLYIETLVDAVDGVDEVGAA